MFYLKNILKLIMVISFSTLLAYGFMYYVFYRDIFGEVKISGSSELEYNIALTDRKELVFF